MSLCCPRCNISSRGSLQAISRPQSHKAGSLQRRKGHLGKAPSSLSIKECHKATKPQRALALTTMLPMPHHAGGSRRAGEDLGTAGRDTADGKEDPRTSSSARKNTSIIPDAAHQVALGVHCMTDPHVCVRLNTASKETRRS